MSIEIRYVFRRKIARDNRKGTCLWCGQKLRKERFTEPNEERRGGYGDNAFCGLRCGYSFGVAAARHGFRLAAYEGPFE